VKADVARKLGREDWFRAGLDARVKSGPEALKAARLARSLGVTTGSFYWHFDCVAEFQAELLMYWQESVVVGLIHSARVGAAEPSRILAELGKLIRKSGAHQIDSAMRDWARTAPEVADSVKSADEIRATFLFETLRNTGMSERNARDRANLIGAAWRGSQSISNPDYRMKLVDIAASG
jgi:AcrR family transcriptional regulator